MISVDLIRHSYLARLENRIQDIEVSLHRLQENQTNDSSALCTTDPDSISSHPVENEPDVPLSKASIPLPSSSAALAQDRAEFGEIDTSENSIDGMGAINFADEEDCGFFG